MSEILPSKEEALRLLRQTGCSQNVIEHCEAVAELAVEFSKACKQKGLEVDSALVEIGALLHDIGRSETHSVHHAVVGAEIAESLGLPEPVISIIKRHVGGGISAKVAEQLGWPEDVYIPQTMEEKIVSYADKLLQGSRRVTIKRTIEKFRADKLPSSTIRRLQRLHKEMSGLVGNCKCQP